MRRRGLQALIKLHRFQLDEKRRKIGQEEVRRAGLVNDQQELKQQIEAEKTAALELQDLQAVYGPYVQRATVERRHLDGDISEAEARVADAQEEALEIYREVKMYELTDAHLKRLEDEERAHRETIELDEIALNMHRAKDKTD